VLAPRHSRVAVPSRRTAPLPPTSEINVDCGGRFSGEPQKVHFRKVLAWTLAAAAVAVPAALIFLRLATKIDLVCA
jgi:hypothetical protein